MEFLLESITTIQRNISSIDQELEILEQSLLNHSQSQYYNGGYNQEIESERERISQLKRRRSELIVLENEIRDFLDESLEKYWEITKRILHDNHSIERAKEEDSKIALNEITLKENRTNQMNKIHLKDNGIPLNDDENKQHSTEGKQFH